MFSIRTTKVVRRQTMEMDVPAAVSFLSSHLLAHNSTINKLFGPDSTSQMWPTAHLIDVLSTEIPLVVQILLYCFDSLCNHRNAT